MIPFSIYVDIAGQEAKLTGQWVGVLATDVEEDIRQYSLNDEDDDDSDCVELLDNSLADLQTCHLDNRISHTNLMRELKMKNKAMIENGDLKNGLEKAKKQNCELKDENERLRKLNTCLKKPCLNDGQCIPEGGDKYKCVCANGYKGEKCEV